MPHTLAMKCALTGVAAGVAVGLSVLPQLPPPPPATVAAPVRGVHVGDAGSCSLYEWIDPKTGARVLICTAGSQNAALLLLPPSNPEPIK